MAIFYQKFIYILRFFYENYKNKIAISTTAVILFLGLFQSCSQEKIEATVFVRKTSSGYELVRNGKIFLIKGTSGNSNFKELKKAGGNTIRIYDTTNLVQTLDEADKAGLAVILDIPIPRYIVPDSVYANNSQMNRLFEDIRAFVIKYKNHPALLYWMLGNELKAPDLPGDDNFYDNFNKLVRLVKETDHNHPVSTAVGGFDRSRILSINHKVNNLDLLSINIFGELSTFGSRKKLIYPLWHGPYVFSEFGVNGPWEAEQTLWNSPIEQTSTKKAEQYKNRYEKYIKTLDDGRFLGSLTFYWGHKQERTHTWFSFFSETGKRTQAVFEMESLWKNQERTFLGPRINYVLLNGKGAQESIILNSNEKVNTQLLLADNQSSSQFKTRWEIRPENWNYLHYGEEAKPAPINNLFLSSGSTKSSFISPMKEGPYRLFVYVEDNKEFHATANVPFYVLNPNNE